MTRGRSRGAYGFRLLGAHSELLVRVPETWPTITISQRATKQPSVTSLELQADHAAVPLVGGGSISLRRLPPSAELLLARQLAGDELVHPYLAPVASVHAYWLGRQTFHAGGLAPAATVWGVLGPREAGKSSFLAEATRQGIRVLSDDLLITDDMTAFAGPRSLDLREPAARHFETGRPLGVVGERERWRIELPPVPPSLLLGGWIFLRWGQRIGIEPLGLRERLARLAAGRSLRSGADDPAPLLSLARLPGLQVTMPRRWTAISSTLTATVAAISESEREA